jgi:hypothetical protein
MNENNAEIPLPESSGTENPVPEHPITSAPPAPYVPVKAKRKIPIIVWIGGCGALLFMCAAVIVAVIYFGLPLFGGDPIVSVVPNSSMMYMGVDLSQTQSENFGDIVTVVQELADEDTGKTMAESLDKLMQDELKMSFTNDVAPWVGRYGAFVITEADFSSDDAKMMFILQTRNQGKTDEFLTTFIAALEKEQGMEFEQSETNGITFYTDKDQEMVFARNGKFVYLANSQDTVLASASLQKSDSLGSLQSYKDGVAVLPKARLATVYMNGNTLAEGLSSFFSDVYGPGYSSYMENIATEGLSGMVMSLSVEEEGLRMDTASIYDETKINEYQKEVLATDYLAPKADALLPEDTFLFMGSNASQAPSSYTKVDNPLYSSDVEESFDMLEQQLGINVRELFDLLGNEVALALGPADDGLFAEAAEINIGFTMLAGTTNEAGFTEWFDGALNKVFTQNMYTEYDISDTKIGEYDLKQLNLPNDSETVAAFIYGADNGYFVLGTSPSMLENGFSGTKTLANNETYRQTWAAFPAGSVPYLYMNVTEFMNFLADNAGAFGGSDIVDAQKKLQKIPVVALSMNNTTGYIQSVTMIVFIDKGEQTR